MPSSLEMAEVLGGCLIACCCIGSSLKGSERNGKRSADESRRTLVRVRIIERGVTGRQRTLYAEVESSAWHFLTTAFGFIHRIVHLSYSAGNICQLAQAVVRRSCFQFFHGFLQLFACGGDLAF